MIHRLSGGLRRWPWGAASWTMKEDLQPSMCWTSSGLDPLSSWGAVSDTIFSLWTKDKGVSAASDIHELVVKNGFLITYESETWISFLKASTYDVLFSFSEAFTNKYLSPFIVVMIWCLLSTHNQQLYFEGTFKASLQRDILPLLNNSWQYDKILL